MGIPYKVSKHPKQNNLEDFCNQNPDAPECDSVPEKPKEKQDIVKKSQKNSFNMPNATPEETINIQEEHKQAQEMVEDILKSDTRARNDDLWLILQIWQKSQQIKVFVPFNEMSSMISPETITRARRKVQNTEEKYLPTDPKVLLRRRVKESVLRRYYADNKKVLDEYDEEKERHSR